MKQLRTKERRYGGATSAVAACVALMAGSVLVGCGEAAQGDSTAGAVPSETAVVDPLEETPESVATQPAATDVATIQVGKRYLWGVAVDPETHTAYVASEGDDTISVIDTVLNQVTATISLESRPGSAGAGPRGLAVDTANRTVYVANFSQETVSVIDATTNQVTTTIPVGLDPIAVAVHSAARTVYAANLESNSVSVIDATTNQVTATIPVGKWPFSIAVDETANRAYVTLWGADSIAVIDTTTNQVTATIQLPTGSSPQGITVDAPSTTAYVVLDNGIYAGEVGVIDTTTFQVTDTITVGENPSSVAVDQAKQLVYITNSRGNTVSVIDATTHQVLATIPVGGYPEGIAVDSLTGTVYVANGGDVTIAGGGDDNTVSVFRIP